MIHRDFKQDFWDRLTHNEQANLKVIFCLFILMMGVGYAIGLSLI